MFIVGLCCALTGYFIGRNTLGIILLSSGAVQILISLILSVAVLIKDVRKRNRRKIKRDKNEIRPPHRLMTPITELEGYEKSGDDEVGAENSHEKAPLKNVEYQTYTMGARIVKVKNHKKR